jgi:hypothetical protein
LIIRIAHPMAIAGRFTIGTLMAVVFLVAADFAIVRALWGTSGPLVGVAIVTLPMIDVLLLAIPHLRKSNPTRPYWGGFQVAGWIGVLTSGLLAWGCPDAFFWPITLMDRWLESPRSDASSALLIAFAVVVYTPTQLLMALLGGRLSATYRIVIERR